MKFAFNKAFYLDGLRRLRLVGYVFLAVCLLFGCLPVLMRADYPQLLGIQELAGVLGFFMYAGPVVLTFTAFSFLFRRSASDVYHALPLTRTGLYASIVASILTYVIGTILLTLLAVHLCLLLFGWPVDWGHFLPLLLSYSFGGMLVTACALVGVSAAGTRFSAFVVGGLLLFLPRCVLLLCMFVLDANAPMLIPSQSGILFDTSYNFPVYLFINGGFGYIFGSYFGGSAEQVFLSVGTKLYTLLLGLLYTALGGYIFHRRTSETAQLAAPGRRTQHLYRCLLALPFLLLMGVLGVNAYYDGGFSSIAAPFRVLAVVVLVIYFVYELITTRKWRNLLPTLYVLPIPIVVSLGLVLCTVLYGNVESHVLPAAEEIASIQIYSPRAYTPSYQELAVEEVRFTDAELGRLAAEGLRFTAGMEDSRQGARLNRMMLQLNLKNGRALHRSFAITPQDQPRFDELLYSSQEYLTASAAIPAREEILSLAVAEYSSDVANDAAFLEQVWAQLQQEALRLPLEERRQLFGRGVMATRYEKDGLPEANVGYAFLDYVLAVSGNHNGQRFESFLTVSTQTPETATLVMRRCNQEAALRLPAAGAVAAAAYEWGDVRVQLCNMQLHGETVQFDDMNFMLNDDSAVTDENKLKLADTLLQLDREGVDASKPYVKFSFNLTKQRGENEYENIFIPAVYASLDEVALQAICSYFPAGWVEEFGGVGSKA